MTGNKTDKTIATSFELSGKRQAEVSELFTNRHAQLLFVAQSPMEENTKREEFRKKLLALNTADQAWECPLSVLDYYKDKLATTNPAIFPFLTKAQQDRLREQLLDTFSLLATQYKRDLIHARGYTFDDHEKALVLCAKRIEELDDSPGVFGEKITCEQALAARISDSEKYLKFLGMIILAPWFVEKMQQFSAGKTVALKEWMTEINGKRLYWVWGGGMLASILDMLPDDFFNKQQAQQSLATPAPVTGYMSWVLYYTRFGINLLLLLKHTIKGPWMNPEEKNSDIDTWERFQTQWQQRKFDLLNDSIWATANMVCFFWLKGSGMYGYAGNVLTVVLLVMDLSFTTWQYWEESTKHNADMLVFERDRDELEKRRTDLMVELFNLAKLKNLEDAATHSKTIETLEARREELDAQIKRLDKMQAKAEFDWKYQRYGLINNWVYALGLMLAFCVLCSFFFPPAAIVPAAAMITSTLGAALCFILTVAYAAMGGYIDIVKSQQTSQQANAEYSDLFKAFQKETDENIKKQLYLEMKGLLAESDHQQRIANFQAIKLVRSILIDACIPAIVFATLMFMPSTLGLGVLATGLALTIISNVIINRFEPHPEQLPEFNQTEYELLQNTSTAAEFENEIKKTKEPIINEKKKKLLGFFDTCLSELDAEDEILFNHLKSS